MLSAAASVTGVRSAGGNDLVTIESEVRDADGGHVVTATSALVVRGEP